MAGTEGGRARLRTAGCTGCFPHRSKLFVLIGAKCVRFDIATVNHTSHSCRWKCKFWKGEEEMRVFIREEMLEVAVSVKGFAYCFFPI